MQGLGVRCSSLADMEKLVATSRMSTSEWSLDVTAGGSGGPNGIVDPAGSLPALWTPLDASATTAVPSSKGRNIRLTLNYSKCRVPTGERKLERVREFEWSRKGQVKIFFGKVRESEKLVAPDVRFSG